MKISLIRELGEACYVPKAKLRAQQNSPVAKMVTLERGLKKHNSAARAPLLVGIT